MHPVYEGSRVLRRTALGLVILMSICRAQAGVFLVHHASGFRDNQLNWLVLAIMQFRGGRLAVGVVTCAQSGHPCLQGLASCGPIMIMIEVDSMAANG
ncbi:hypothetical protein HYDPIDRAFT_118930 [Hydnomerulius pinastri MD-312]|uniref:Uncharacterized protein n=1 Tax=Hydnomerulius pinastri MD-312 TaxID=994086 RepID=A0A0C9V105_9AGAM|nr:hypothetical protein HYDPIDRAFT_118930 [Hydnomerulius pinastri MD-312]